MKRKSILRNMTLAAALLTLLFSCKKDMQSEAVKSSGNASSATAGGKRIYFNNPGNYIDQNFNYAAGDTFVLKAGINYTYFSMANIHDVTIINEGGVAQLKNGFNFNSCTNITLTGTGSKDVYGFEVSDAVGGGPGVDINGKSSSVTVNNIYIHDKTYGFWVKQEVANTCDASLYYPNWYIDNIKIFNNMIKSMAQEGMYLGSSGQNADRVNGCGNYPYPMRLSNISVHDNIVDSTGRGGIQLSGADKGVNEIYNNKITRAGFEFNNFQGNGVVIGGNCYADIHHNTIKNTLCDGIWVLGTGTTNVYNNKIDSSGWLAGKYAGGMHGIAFDTRASYPFTQSTFNIQNNKIGKHTDASSDIFIYNTPQNDGGKSVSGFSQDNNVYNNNKGRAVVKVQSGIVYSTIQKPLSQ